jgi:hypothetical protein
VDPGRGVVYALQNAPPLAAAHAKGVVHRDLKPENVFLQRTPDGEEIVKIVDFGIAQLRTNEEAAVGAKQRRLTRTGMIFGTPEYMSPEQAGGKHADQRADIYAVGIILYEMFTGAVPFTGETFLGVLAKHLNETAPPMSVVYPELGISRELQAVIGRALEKSPDARFQSMSELSRALSGTPEGRATFERPAALASSATEFHEYQAVPTGAFTEPQFRNQASERPIAQSALTSTSLTDSAAPAATEPGAGTSPKIVEGRQREEPRVATAATIPPAQGKAGALVALALLLAGAAAALLAWRHEAAADPPVARLAAAEGPGAAPTLVERRATAAQAVVTGAPAAPASVVVSSSVRLAVVTDPPGAMLSKDGFQVCDKTPCEVTAAPNETLELEATKGGLSGKAKVLAQRDQNVSIKLVGAPVKKGPAKPRLCEVELDGIKILRPCQ